MLPAERLEHVASVHRQGRSCAWGLTFTETTGTIAMAMPGGSRQTTRSDTFPREGETSLENSHKSAESVNESTEYPSDGHMPDCFTRGRASGSAAPSGVWLGADDGTVLFFPVSAGVDRSPLPPAADDSRLDAADQATLDAASWLMPKLPRELIAEYLGLHLPRE
jgi:hypothetical protein